MTLTDLRMRLSTATFWSSVIVAVVLLFEIALLFVASYGRVWLLHHFHWLRMHADDRSLLHLFANSWAVAILISFLCLFGIGRGRRRSVILSVSNVVGFPATLVAVVVLDRFIR